MKNILSSLLIWCSVLGFAQTSDSAHQELSLLFIGDIMGHGPQITSAYDSETKTYNYDKIFKYINSEVGDADYTIANLEVTLAGPPYKGYPQFSSPDNLAAACKNAGIDVLVTSNNHSCDRGGKGIIRTCEVLDSLPIMHTGTFKDSTDRKLHYPLIIESDCMRIAILNYTYGTNGLPYPAPTIVNMIDKDLMKRDLEIAKSKNVDKIIVVTHWGSEYKLQPVPYQIDHGKFLFENGADIIVGMHPHVLEKMVWEKASDSLGKESLIVYSLGNFVSNQRKRYTDGGAMFKLTLQKEGNQTSIKDGGYMLTWVYTPQEKGKKQYYILPAAKYENNPDFFDNEASYTQMKAFIKDSRELFDTENENIPEYRYQDDKWYLNK
jgi:poly-gamma-glutamate synthesis protein (capsule biosynthesis protein)